MINENTVDFNRHAVRRMAQRNLTFADIYTVIRLGQKIYRAGAIFYFLGRRDVPEGKEKRLEKLIGTTVIRHKNSVVTAYRNRRAIGTIKRKSKRKHIKSELAE